MRFIKLLFIISLLFTFLQASNISNKYIYAKKNYVTAVLKDNKSKEIQYLKEIIKYGKKLGKNVSRYEKELQKIDKSKKASIQKKSFEKPKKSFSIKSVYTDENKIIINFNHRVSKKHIKFSESKTKNGYQDIFDFTGRFKDAKPTKLTMSGVRKITIFQYRYNTLRIILSNKTNPNTIYIINNKQIIIKFLDSKKTQKTIPVKKKVQEPKPVYKKQTPKKLPANSVGGLITSNKVIVIDAGHGGKDPGAVGPYKRYEKHVTLAVSKYLRDELKAKGFQVYLTRTKDRFISLRYRTQYANKKNADLFLSIHTNSTVKKNAHKSRGLETYFLSPARSERAKRVAAKENKSEMNSMGYTSQNILLTLLNNSKIISSQKMAIDVQKNMLYELRKTYGKKSIVDGGVREAPFWVLVGAQMPAVLVELGYISHPTESRRLFDKKYQKKLAKGMAKGIIDYFKHNQ